SSTPTISPASNVSPSEISLLNIALTGLAVPLPILPTTSFFNLCTPGTLGVRVVHRGGGSGWRGRVGTWVMVWRRTLTVPQEQH
ncbi:hypothetical protein, partial [Anaplasma marginale]|uniref:hypothetical protein n=1 Tax=Anaplasma marginale TaxID=770 RepID=UPI001D036800